MLSNYYISEMTEVTRKMHDNAPEYKKIPKVIIEYNKAIEYQQDTANEHCAWCLFSRKSTK